MDHVNIASITTDNRVRKELGNIDELAASIKEFGLIQPIILTLALEPQDGIIKEFTRLIAGGRRLEAVKRLGWTELAHGRDFIWRDEVNFPNTEEKKLRFQAVEMEENLRRKSLTWQEEIEGKQKLLALMQKIYGTAKMGAPTKSERLSGTTTGFGVNKLSSMLGESNAQTSNDLALAAAIKAAPQLAKAQSKEEAKRQMTALLLAALAKEQGVDVKAPSFMPHKELLFQVIVKCRDEAHQRELLDRFQKEGLECRALIS